MKHFEPDEGDQQARLVQIRSELCKSGKAWSGKFKDTYEFWSRKAGEEEFWGPAANVVWRFGIPSDLLLPVVSAHLNDRPEDPYSRFQVNVMRSEALMTRAVRNFQEMMVQELKRLAIVHRVVRGSALPETSGVLETARLCAGLSLDYFRLSLELRAVELDRNHRNPDNIPPVVKDSMAFRFCGKNPFLLVATARDPRLRHLAACNIQRTVAYLPWNYHIWEGVIDGKSLGDYHALAGPPPEVPPFEGGGIGYGWPENPWGFAPMSANRKSVDLVGPTTYLRCNHPHGFTNLYLEMKDENLRSGSGDPPPPR